MSPLPSVNLSIRFCFSSFNELFSSSNVNVSKSIESEQLPFKLPSLLLLNVLLKRSFGVPLDIGIPLGRWGDSIFVMISLERKTNRIYFPGVNVFFLKRSSLNGSNFTKRTYNETIQSFTSIRTINSFVKFRSSFLLKLYLEHLVIVIV